MNHDVIPEVVAWIETQLSTRLSIDEVASRSGYSKWHLQRTYLKSTGMSLGEYIRRRQLSCAAAELRLTRLGVIDVAMKYGFSSQQTFTRAFRAYFGQPPGRYRRLSEWDCSQLFPPYHKTVYPVGKPEVVSMPCRVLSGTVNKFSCELGMFGLFNMEVRYRFFRRSLRNDRILPHHTWGVTDFHSNPDKSGIIDIRYITATEEGKGDLNYKEKIKVIIPAGSYLQFHYNGRSDGFQDFILDVNRIHLPRLGVVRRQGADLELFSFTERNKRYLESGFMNCSYYVPFTYFRE
ncbi:RobA family efflux pump transcriptional activator [Pectobacterium carotovorum subsp. carotovorum]|nr:RobA family efflux pump transcriptional activator [Pectobacterium carotovorum subsp. carotovorum]